MEEKSPFAFMPATSSTTPEGSTMAILLVFLFSTAFEIFSRAGFEYILSLPWKQFQQVTKFGRCKYASLIHPAPLDDDLNAAGVGVVDFGDDSEYDSYMDQLEAGHLLAKHKPVDTDTDDATPLKTVSLRQRIWGSLSHGVDYAATYLLMIIAMCKSISFFHAAILGHACGRFVRLTVEAIHNRMELRLIPHRVADHHHAKNHIAITIPPAEAPMV
jgi:hypothetical protein